MADADASLQSQPTHQHLNNHPALYLINVSVRTHGDMKTTARCSSIWTRRFHASARYCQRPVRQAESSPSPNIDVQAFRSRAFDLQQPLHISQTDDTAPLVSAATRSWFREATPGHWSLTPRVMAEEDWPFPYELVTPSDEPEKAHAGFRDWLLQTGEFKDMILAGTLQSVIGERESSQSFFQFQAPLRLLQQAVKYNHAQSSQPDAQMLQLYIAQSSLSELPETLQVDVLPPELVLKAGKGDIYASSVWLGTEPTFTPLHRDPNPNLFCQLQSSKIVRLLPPSAGEMLYFEVQARIRQQGSSRIRTAEGMMEGLERKVLGDAVWGDEVNLEDMQEATVHKGDALFIPKGWWHSIRSVGSRGGLNGSVNWWFR